MDIIEFLKSNSVTFEKNIYFMEEYKESEFERCYILLRAKEHRIYDDSIVKNLPNYEGKDSNLSKEWKVRKNSADRLKTYVSEHYQIGTVLEIGCGNGWLSNYLRTENNRVIGLDVTVNELIQASKLFYNQKNLQFAFGDLFKIKFPKNSFDVIVFASSIQYFPDLSKVIQYCIDILSETGEIHIIDTNFYSSDQVESAKERSHGYYTKIGFPEMALFYFHHTQEEIYKFNSTILYDPQSPVQKIRNKFINKGFEPFPWIKIQKNYTDKQNQNKE